MYSDLYGHDTSALLTERQLAVAITCYAIAMVQRAVKVVRSAAPVRRLSCV